MYGKVHAKFFRSSINDADPIVRFVFIGMIVLSDREGTLDITRSALARELNLSQEDVDHAIEVLSQPDELSRSREHEGRRIIGLDDARSWGWKVVNKERYRATDGDPEILREQTRERVRKFRAKKNRSDSDTYTDTDETPSNARNGGVTEKALRQWFGAAWAEYPRKAGKKAAWAHYRRSVSSKHDHDQLLSHLTNYKAQIQANGTELRYVLHGGTWFNNWRDEIYASGPQPARPRGLVV